MRPIVHAVAIVADAHKTCTEKFVLERDCLLNCHIAPWRNVFLLPFALIVLSMHACLTYHAHVSPQSLV